MSKNICFHQQRRFWEILLAKRKTRGCKMLLANRNEMSTAIVKVPLPRVEKWLWWKTEHPMKTSERTPECVSCLQPQTLFCECIHHIKFTDSRMNLGHWFWNPKNFLWQDLCIDIKCSTNFVAEIFFFTLWCNLCYSSYPLPLDHKSANSVLHVLTGFVTSWKKFFEVCFNYQRFINRKKI